MALTSADELRRATRIRRTVDVEVPDLGTVRLVALTAGEAIEISGRLGAGEDEVALTFEYVVRSMVDEAGDPVFAAEEAEAIGRSLPPLAFRRLQQEYLALNAVGVPAEAAAKNSGASRDASSRTGSRKRSGTPTST